MGGEPLSGGIRLGRLEWGRECQGELLKTEARCLGIGVSEGRDAGCADEGGGLIGRVCGGLNLRIGVSVN